MGTLPRTTFKSTDSPLGGWRSPGMAVGRFLDVIEPFTLPERRDELGERLRRHADEQVAIFSTWPLVSWNVEAQHVEARVWHFASGWLAICTNLSESYVVAIGTGTAPDDLCLTITSGAEYGVDFSRPITLGHIQQRSEAAVMPRPNQPHPDLLPFLLPNF
ncbi:hypothetical protein [Amycolatopsis aidingensis]|uniref:hypothetical protein n=1 Tax=Amycolatopsis aidingensis TaxID=2842453 RepID=UPI001C0C13E2|nr:hypothetical protein [Amycolatopsis aidingensis]